MTTRRLARHLIVVACALTTSSCFTEYIFVVSASDSGSSGSTSAGSSESSSASSNANVTSMSTGATPTTSGSQGASTALCEQCAGQCVDLDVDPEHCGACDSPCAPPSECVAGVCEPALCTGCDAQLELCVEGECVCKPGLERCAGACVDTSSEAEHCGGCSEPCVDGLCISGVCTMGSCSAPLSQCGDLCVDGSKHPLHCGECNNSCEADELCADGECSSVSVATCTSCPCPRDCGRDARCCDLGLAKVICLDSDECPSS